MKLQITIAIFMLLTFSQATMPARETVAISQETGQCTTGADQDLHILDAYGWDVYFADGRLWLASSENASNISAMADNCGFAVLGNESNRIKCCASLNKTYINFYELRDSLMPNFCLAEGRMGVGQCCAGLIRSAYYIPGNSKDSCAKLETPGPCIKCGDSICAMYEDRCNCPQDCATAVSLVNETNTDNKTKTDKGANADTLWPILPLVIIIAVVAFLAFLKIRKRWTST